MLGDNTHMRILTFSFLLFLVGGCSIIDPTLGGRSAEKPTEAQMRLAGTLNNYRLPEQSIPPTQHPDSAVDAAINAMSRIAQQQHLIFDGSRATEGYVIVGRMGSTAQMLLGLNVYPVAGRVGFRDVTNWKMSDISEGKQMRQRFLNALK
ncbi:MAG: hypothetical protein HZA89_04980 [Verrucomicrobia bacterium]|nr:hypothetical protein [Verrucomicrobiota bacterium]